MKRIEPEAVTDALCYHGEGPVWLAEQGAIAWVDMLAGDLLTRDEASGEVARRHLGDVLAAVRPRESGGLVLALERGFALLDPGADTPVVLPDLWPERDVRMNEGGCDPQGRFYCGSMHYDALTGRGALFRLHPGGTVEPVLTGITISNGLDWSPDGNTAYYVDSPTGRIDAIDVDGGEFGRRRELAAIPAELGVPDGLTVDAEGCVWVAVFGGGQVRRYLTDGTLDQVIELPVREVTACAFGGPDLDRLFITTSREGQQPGDEPLAGSLFVAEPGVRGRPVRTFAG